MMVGTLGIALAVWLAAGTGVDSATARGPLHSQREQDPPPKEAGPPAKEPENKHATVEGHVKLRDGRPAAGARIVAKGPSATVANATADGAGKFRFAGPAGRYSLEIQAGDRSRTFKADIADGKLTPAAFTVE